MEFRTYFVYFHTFSYNYNSKSNELPQSLGGLCIHLTALTLSYKKKQKQQQQNKKQKNIKKCKCELISLANYVCAYCDNPEKPFAVRYNTWIWLIWAVREGRLGTVWDVLESFLRQTRSPKVLFFNSLFSFSYDNVIVICCMLPETYILREIFHPPAAKCHFYA